MARRKRQDTKLMSTGIPANSLSRSCRERPGDQLVRPSAIPPLSSGAIRQWLTFARCGRRYRGIFGGHHFQYRQCPRADICVTQSKPGTTLDESRRQDRRAVVAFYRSGRHRQQSLPRGWQVERPGKSFGTKAAVMRFAASDVEEEVVPGSGHWMTEENPKAIVVLVRAFPRQD